MKKSILSFMTIMLLSACVKTSAEIKTYETPRFATQEPIKLNVKEVETITEFVPTFVRPNVEHLFPVSIENTAKVWADDRLEAANSNSTRIAVVTIKNASVTEELVKSEKILEKDQLKYTAKLHVELKISDEASLSSAQTEIQAWRELSIPFDTPLEKKEEYWSKMVEKLFYEYNIQMTKNINEYLGQYVIK